MGGAFLFWIIKKEQRKKGFWVIKYKREFQTIPYFFLEKTIKKQKEQK